MLVVVDGTQQETLALAAVMGVDTLVHRPEGILGNRTNANVRFALNSVFRHFPRADKAIVLEDDLLLSPDFLRLGCIITSKKHKTDLSRQPVFGIDL